MGDRINLEAERTFRPSSSPPVGVIGEVLCLPQHTALALLDGGGSVRFGTRLAHEACSPFPLAGKAGMGGKLAIAAAPTVSTPTLTPPSKGRGSCCSLLTRVVPNTIGRGFG
jgi:hypothetical protein